MRQRGLTREKAVACFAFTITAALAAPLLSEEKPGMTQHATGSFVVTITPEAQDARDASTLGRMSLAKTFEGDLDGAAEGTMLTGVGSPPTSAAYVAIERFTGTVHGRSGSFLLVHRGVMTQEAQDLLITVVPDSATGELAGLEGTFKLEIVDGKHLYDLEYTQD